MEKVRKRTIKKVHNAIHEEKEAINNYRKDAKRVDPKTAKVFREIAGDEVHHKKQLGKIHKRLCGGKRNGWNYCILCKMSEKKRND